MQVLWLMFPRYNKLKGMDKELERLVNSVIEKAIDDSDASADLVDALVNYYNGISENYPEGLGRVMLALHKSAENGCSWAKVQFARMVYFNIDGEGCTLGVKRLGSDYGRDSGYLWGSYYAAKILEDPEFRPREYFYHPNAGLLGRHLLNEPDYALRDAADCYQAVVDGFDPGEDGVYPGFVLESATLAAQLNLNKRGFGPGPIDVSRREFRSLQDLKLVEEKGNAEQGAYALSIRGAHWLATRRFDLAIDCFLQALELSPNTISFIRDELCSGMNPEDFKKLLSACEKAVAQGDPDLAEDFNHFKGTNIWAFH